MIKFLIEIAVVHTLFYFIWNYVFTLAIAVLTALLNIDTWVMYLPKGLGAIVLASLSSLIIVALPQGNTVADLVSCQL